ncbi:MAG: YgiQ family radical SAM protein [Bacteroidales bacterium]|nr:YgiQ family radical SAM protein [Bacteroidales bacterium]
MKPETMKPATYMFPTSVKEVEALGWDFIDIIFITGDAFVDHPSFGTACIARYLQKYGYRIAIVPQPGWKDDLRDFRKLGRPRLYFAINAGAMDSMVNHYTAAKRLRHDDAYTPEGRFGARPDRAVTVYTRALKSLWPDVPLVIGGVEASLRRLTHYDYWDDRLHPSVLCESGADWLCYGMGERTMLALTRAIEQGWTREDIETLPQIGFYKAGPVPAFHDNDDPLVLASYETCLKDKRAFATNFHWIERNANAYKARPLIEAVGNGYVRLNPPLPPATTEEMDSFWDLPFTKRPHPRYKGKRIPAYDMIKDSIITHRGCFGGCNFCTIAAHQGKFIQSRSEDSIIKEVKSLAAMPEFKGNISDLGAPTANMYGLRGRDEARCQKCLRKSCLFPGRCDNMDISHERLLKLYERVCAVEGVRHAYIGSGIRYDLFLDKDGFLDKSGAPYLRALMLEHCSGRLKVAPEHTEDKVLQAMAKPSFAFFERLRKEFDRINAACGTHVELVPYFISSHPGCHLGDMLALRSNPALRGIWMDQVQDFMPTPMTASSVMFYSGFIPDAKLTPIFTEKDPERKKKQKGIFFRHR